MSTESSAIVVCPNCGRKNRVPAAANGAPRCAQCHSPLPWITTADDGSYRAVVDDAAIPVLVDLWAPWCGPCHVIGPILDELARARAGRVKLVRVNVDESPQVASRHAVQGIPTLLIVDHGEVVARHTGAAPQHVLGSWLDEALTSSTRSGSSTAD